MALTFDISNNIMPDGVKECPVDSSERTALMVKKVNFTDKAGDGTALQSGETVNLMELGKNVVITRMILRITTAFTTGIDIGFAENSDGTKDRDEFFDGVASAGTYVFDGNSTGAASAAITAAGTYPATSTKDDYCVTLEAKANQTGGGVADLIVEYYKFL
tara:strand:+ start:70 stop:552 length:483 start_codon:yes stop_codon:yes gene_type:complete